MKKKKILLVDDNYIDNFISKHIITKSTIAEKLDVFTSPIEALEYLETKQSNHEEFPDFIFLDIRMPEMDGFGFLDAYSKFHEDVIMNTYIFMLSSSSYEKDIERALKYPVVKKYLVKPLTKDVFNELVQSN